jgi:uncharacterized membrane protein
MTKKLSKTSSQRNFLSSLIFKITVRPRLIISILLGSFVYFLMPQIWRMETRGLISWNIAAIFYLILFFHLAETADVHKIKTRAKLQDDGAVLILILSGLAAAMCFVAIAFELANLKGISGADRNWHLALVILTIPLNWAFIHSMYALHYAHEFYDALDAAGHGLDFPGINPPTYWDFIYFSYIIGTSGQTADVGITCPSIRKTATIHCVFSFFFNLTTLGLSINVASSLF